MFIRSLRMLVTLAMLGAGLTACTSVSQVAGMFGGGGAGGAAAVRPSPPHLLHTEVRLADHPTEQMLAAYYCSKLVHVPAPLPSPCSVFGPIPTAQQIRFTFAVDLTLRNENQVPLPTAEALLAFTAYPAATNQQNLGALCVSLRDADQVTDAPNGCQDTGDSIRTAADFAGAAARFLVNVATARTQVGELRVRTIPPGGEVHVVVQLGLDPEQTLTLIQHMSQDSLSSLQRGQAPHFAVPYALEGSLWVEVENFGRFAVSIPRIEGSFDLGR